MTALISSTIAATSLPFLAYADPMLGAGVGFGVNGIYWIMIIGVIALSGIASLLVRIAYSRYSKVPASSGLTGAQLAQRILQSNGIHDVSIHAAPGHLTDHYDPSNKQLVLSEANYHGTSVAALGVSAHECGHAIQHQQAYAPLHWRMAAVGITNFASKSLSWIMLLSFAGAIMNIALPYNLMITAFALAFGVIMVFQLITLPVEFDATKRAKSIVGQLGVLGSPAETQGMNRVLNAAALTYVAAFIAALAQFLYYFWRMQNSRN